MGAAVASALVGGVGGYLWFSGAAKQSEAVPVSAPAPDMEPPPHAVKKVSVIAGNIDDFMEKPGKTASKSADPFDVDIAEKTSPMAGGKLEIRTPDGEVVGITTIAADGGYYLEVPPLSDRYIVRAVKGVVSVSFGVESVPVEERRG